LSRVTARGGLGRCSEAEEERRLPEERPPGPKEEEARWEERKEGVTKSWARGEGEGFVWEFIDARRGRGRGMLIDGEEVGMLGRA
jgi:hypothetical protein